MGQIHAANEVLCLANQAKANAVGLPSGDWRSGGELSCPSLLVKLLDREE
jgi:hypothetical protein